MLLLTAEECTTQTRSDVLYHLWNGHCFLVSQDDHQSWFNARNLCGELGGSLLQIVSRDMHDFVASAVEGLFAKHWIGLSKHNYIWSTGIDDRM